VFERLRARRAPQWIGNPRAVHTFTYTPDAGRTLALLGNTESAYGQVWHAATSRDEMEGMEMLYQLDYDYRFDSSKLERAFALEATSYAAGIAAALASSTP
jgi:hypothetical protein